MRDSLPEVGNIRAEVSQDISLAQSLLDSDQAFALLRKLGQRDQGLLTSGYFPDQDIGPWSIFASCLPALVVVLLFVDILLFAVLFVVLLFIDLLVVVVTPIVPAPFIPTELPDFTVLEADVRDHARGHRGF